MKKIGFGIATILLLFGCASVPTPVSLQVGDGQELSYSHGTGCVESGADMNDGFILTSLCAQSKSVGRSVLIVRVANRTSQSITIEEGAVSAMSATGPLEVLAYTALMKEEQTRQAWAAVATGLAAAGNSMAASNAGYSSYQGTAHTSASVYGSGGYGGASATTRYSGTSYNGAAATAAQQVANAENARLLEQLEASSAMGEQVIEGALRTHTIEPGDFHAAYVEVELPRLHSGVAQHLDVVLRLQGMETHFQMSVGP